MKAFTQTALISLITLTAAIFWLDNLHAAEIVVQKEAQRSNPVLAVKNVEAPSKMRTLLVNTLRRSNWFTVVEGEKPANYNLRAALSNNRRKLKIQISADQNNILAFTHTVSRPVERAEIYSTVDTIIRRLFENPGLCSSRIAFVLREGTVKEIFTCNFDGTGTHRITHNSTISTEPAWARSPQKLLYTAYRNHGTGIVLADLKNDRQRRVAGFSGLNAGATMSPQENALALTLSYDGQVDLYIAPMDGADTVRMTSDSAVESSPVWSPKGHRICYVSDKTGQPQLYTISVKGRKVNGLTRAGSKQVSPDWSSVSNKICFALKRNNRYEIAVLDMSKSRARPQVVTPEEGNWESPSWAPDGRHLVCTRQVGRQKQLCMVDTLTGNVRKITKPANVSLPAWSPQPNDMPDAID